MNYQIIKDEKLLKEFIDWLPELTDQEKYYLCLFSRSKYLRDENGVNRLPHIKTDKAQLKRFVSDKKRMFNKIQQLEIAEGAYLQGEHVVPQEALALYITVNPRNMWKASLNSMIKLAQAIRDDNKLMNPHQEVMSEIQRTKSRTCYIDFDFDIEEKMFHVAKRVAEESVGMEAITWLKTRGGLHCLIDPLKVPKENKNSWYQNISKAEGVDQTGDMMIPVPGCTQGNFIPHFINL